MISSYTCFIFSFLFYKKSHTHKHRSHENRHCESCIVFSVQTVRVVRRIIIIIIIIFTTIMTTTTAFFAPQSFNKPQIDCCVGSSHASYEKTMSTCQPSRVFLSVSKSCGRRQQQRRRHCHHHQQQQKQLQCKRAVSK